MQIFGDHTHIEALGNIPAIPVIPAAGRHSRAAVLHFDEGLTAQKRRNKLNRPAA
jgi:hypothetical protein